MANLHSYTVPFECAETQGAESLVEERKKQVMTLFKNLETMDELRSFIFIYLFIFV